MCIRDRVLVPRRETAPRDARPQNFCTKKGGSYNNYEAKIVRKVMYGAAVRYTKNTKFNVLVYVTIKRTAIQFTCLLHVTINSVKVFFKPHLCIGS